MAVHNRSTQNEAMLRSLGYAFGFTQVGITITDPTGKIIYTNPADAKLHGYKVSELIGQHARIFSPPDHWNPMSPDEMREIRSWHREGINVRKDGTKFPVFLTSDVILTKNGEPVGIVTTCKDATEQKQAEQALLESELRFRSVAQSAIDAVILSDSDGKILFWNNAATATFGYSVEDVLYESVELIMPERYRSAHQAALKRLQRTKTSHLIGRVVEMHGLRKNGEEFPIELALGTWNIGEKTYFSAILRDISRRKQYERELRQYQENLEGLVQERTAELESANRKLENEIRARKRAEEALERQAFYDSLTELPNRALFHDRLSQAFRRARRRRDYLFALLYLDLDRFKEVNDTYGHIIGDRLLIAVSRKLESCVRPGDTVSRLGGDEFTILLDDVRDLMDATQVAERIISSLSVPLVLEGFEIKTGASIGIALSEGAHNKPEDLLREADEAMYRAKQRGRACHEVYR
jgi:diguanylate cyclase (GGDEF)-like protein/PAS domain S-box-containing protein